MEGKYEEGNVIEVELIQCDTQTANHIMWHFANWQLYGLEGDKVAYKMLSGCFSKEELIYEKIKLGGRIAGRANKESGHMQRLGEIYGALAMAPNGWLYENRAEYGKLGGEATVKLGVGIHSTPRDERVALAKRIYAEGKALAAMTEEEKSAAGRKGGERGGATNKKNKTGVCGITPEEHSKRVVNTNKQKWKCPKCEYINNARYVNSHMLEEHGLPGNSKQRVVLG
jgi:hypothetical protein